MVAPRWIGVTNHPTSTSTTSGTAEAIALGYDSRSLPRTRAFGRLVDRAAEAYAGAAEFAEDDDPDAPWEAMNAALACVARGFAAGTLEALLRDDLLGLTLEQVSRLDALMIELDVETVEILAEPAMLPHPDADALEGTGR